MADSIQHSELLGGNPLASLLANAGRNTYKTFDPKHARNLEEAIHAALPEYIHDLAALVQANLPVDSSGTSERVWFITALLSQLDRTERNHWFRAMEVAVSTACINEDISMNNDTDTNSERVTDASVANN